MAVNYKDALKNLFEEEKTLFNTFKLVHDTYVKDPQSIKTEFDELGSEVMKKLKHAEDMLCRQTETGRFNKFSNQLSEKFWGEVKKYYPAIDEVQVDYGIKGVDIDDLF